MPLAIRGDSCLTADLRSAISRLPSFTRYGA